MVGLVVFPPQVTSTLVEENIVELVAVVLLVTIAVVEDDTVMVGDIPSPVTVVGVSDSAVEQK